jgi:aminoglycoside 2''-phosphotransferase
MQTIAGLKHDEFNQAAAAEVRRFCKGPVEELTFIEHGADNLILLANREFVFRFPRDEAAGRRLYFETALLQKLAGRIRSITVPEVLHVNHQPLFVVARYLEGVHLTGPQIKALSTEEQEQIGVSAAGFMAEFNNTVSGLEIQRLRHEAGLDMVSEPWDPYFRRLFETQPLPNDKLLPVVQEFYPLWKDYVVHEDRTHAIHDDLHPVNLLFLGSRLSGILDFGDANIGGVEEEMRWLYLMGDTVLNAAIAEHARLTGREPNYQHIRVWAIMHELSSFTNGLARGQTESFPFMRARANLKEWLPDFPV